MEKDGARLLRHQVSIYLPHDIYERLMELAAEDDRKLAAYIVRQLRLLSDVGGKSYENS